MEYNIGNIDKLSIITYPDPVLKQVAEPVKDVTPEIIKLAQRMTDLMIKNSGIGLAAPQVGVSLRIVVISLTGKHDDAEVFINPELSNFHGRSEMEEGCLSVPNVRAKVQRFGACNVRALDLEGNQFLVDAVELAAIVFQHETDHLDGVLFIDRLNTVSRMVCRRAIKQLEQQYQAGNSIKKK